MNAFLHVITYKYEVFAITDGNDIWRVWFNGNQPMMQLVCSPFDDEYYPAVKLLRAMKGLYE